METISLPAPELSVLNPASGAEAFARLRTELNALSRSDLRPPRVDVQLAAAFAHGVAVRDLDPERRARFDALSTAGVWDRQGLESLLTVASATWYCRRQYEQQDAIAKEGRIPPESVQQASKLRLRMLRLLEYHLSEHEDYRARLDAIRSGHGYQDLANDLQALHEIYGESEARSIIEGDVRNYRSSDAERAKEMAAAIFSELGPARERERMRWLRLTTAAWSLLEASYRKVALAGRFLFVDDEDVTVTYPALVTAVRARRRSSRSVNEVVKSAPSGSERP